MVDVGDDAEIADVFLGGGQGFGLCEQDLSRRLAEACGKSEPAASEAWGLSAYT
jgi:hypothetical protein